MEGLCSVINAGNINLTTVLLRYFRAFLENHAK